MERAIEFLAPVLMLSLAAGGALASCSRHGTKERVAYGPSAAAPPTVAELMQPGPSADSSFAPVKEPEFAEIMARTAGEKEAVMQRQKAHLAERYDLADKPHATAKMTGSASSSRHFRSSSSTSPTTVARLSRRSASRASIVMPTGTPTPPRTS